MQDLFEDQGPTHCELLWGFERTMQSNTTLFGVIVMKLNNFVIRSNKGKKMKFKWQLTKISNGGKEMKIVKIVHNKIMNTIDTKKQRILMKLYSVNCERWNWKLQKKNYVNQEKKKLQEQGWLQIMKMMLQMSNDEKIVRAKQS